MDSRGIGLTAARGAALTLSIGIVAALMVRASSGCSDRSEIGADPAKSMPAGSAAGTTPEDARDPIVHSPSNSSAAGDGRQLAPSGNAAVEAPASAAPSAQPDVAVDSDPGFFPATKSGAPIPRRHQPQQQQNPAPPQQVSQ